MDTLIYLYGIVPEEAPDSPADLLGIDSRPVRVARCAGLGGLISELPAEAYSDTALEAGLAELAWVGQRGLEHERVLDWFADRVPVVPLSLFSLHANESRMRGRIAADSDRFDRLLQRLRGRREWGIKLWRDESRAAERLEELSPAAAGLAREIEQSPPGRRFLLGKKLESVRADELRRVSARVSHEAYARLRSCSVDSALMQLPSAAANSSRTLLVHAAFLVEDSRFDSFQRALSELAGQLQPAGFEFDFSGPWPAYHFSNMDG